MKTTEPRSLQVPPCRSTCNIRRIWRKRMPLWGRRPVSPRAPRPARRPAPRWDSPRPGAPDGRGGKHLPFGAHAEDDHGGHDHDEVCGGSRRPSPARQPAQGRPAVRAPRRGPGDTAVGSPSPVCWARAQPPGLAPHPTWCTRDPDPGPLSRVRERGPALRGRLLHWGTRVVSQLALGCRCP